MDLDMLNMLHVLLLLKKDIEQSFYRNLFDKFVLFDDHEVYNLFYYENCSYETYSIIKEYDIYIQNNSSFLLYEQFNDNLTANDFQKYETILTQNDDFKFTNMTCFPNIYASSHSNNQVNLMVNTLNLISNSAISNKVKQNIASKRQKKAKKIKDMLVNPSKFLATIQIGITLAGFLSSAFASETFASELAPILNSWIPQISLEAWNNIAIIVITIIL